MAFVGRTDVKDYSERSLAAVVDALGPADAARVVSGNIKKFLGI
jgi:hypothetical protein